MRYVGKDFPLQDPTETADLPFDFSRHPDWERWDYILSVSVANTVVDGTDASHNTRTAAPPTFCGSWVTQRFANPVNGTKYKVVATAAMNSGEILALYANLTGQA